MAAILTPEGVARWIAAGYTFVNERGAVGVRLEPAAAIVGQHCAQFSDAAAAAACSVGETAVSAVTLNGAGVCRDDVKSQMSAQDRNVTRRAK